MPKMKTHSSAKKRFRVTGKGKIKHFQAGKRHLLRKRSKKAKTRLTGPDILSAGDARRVRALLCI